MVIDLIKLLLLLQVHTARLFCRDPSLKLANLCVSCSLTEILYERIFRSPDKVLYKDMETDKLCFLELFLIYNLCLSLLQYRLIDLSSAFIIVRYHVLISTNLPVKVIHLHIGFFPSSYLPIVIKIGLEILINLWRHHQL